jgi:hypothetical protein
MQTFFKGACCYLLFLKENESTDMIENLLIAVKLQDPNSSNITVVSRRAEGDARVGIESAFCLARNIHYANLQGSEESIHKVMTHVVDEAI